MRNKLKLLTAFLLLSIFSCRQIYSYEEIKQFKQGDTIYVSHLDIVERELLLAVVERNDTAKQIIIAKRESWLCKGCGVINSEIYQYSELP